MARLSLAVVALLGSTAGLAATVNIVPSSFLVAQGQTFTLTISANVPNTFAATMGLSFDPTVVTFVSGAALSPWNVFVKNSPANANPTVFDVETPVATGPNPDFYNVAQLTFMALGPGGVIGCSQLLDGSGNCVPNATIVISDDGGNQTGWFDADTADYIPVTYQWGIVPIPPAVWLFGSALGVMGWMRRKVTK